MRDDAELDALVIRNIGDIEAALNHAIEEIDVRLWEEAGRAVTTAPDAATWHAVSEPEEEDAWFAKRSWLLPDAERSEADFWLGLDQRASPDGGEDRSWLATFTGSGPNGGTLALWVDQNILGKAAWKRLLKANADAVADLKAAGFEVADSDDRRLCMPILIDREQLASAAEGGDFAEACEPVAAAVRRAVAAELQLDRLRELAVAAA